MISNVSCEPSLVLRYSLHKCMVFLFSLLWWNAGEKSGWGGMIYFILQFERLQSILVVLAWGQQRETGCESLGGSGEVNGSALSLSPLPENSPSHSLLSKIVLLSSTSPEHSKGHIQGCTLLMPQVFIDPIEHLMTVNHHNMWLPNCMPWNTKHIFLFMICFY